MPLPVLTDVFQCVLNWTNANAPRDAANVLYFHDLAGGQSEANLNTDFAANVDAIMWQAVTANARVNGMRVTKLDGSSAGVSFTIAAAAKWTGGGGADCILQGAQVISMQSLQRGPRGRGRVYLPWISEDRQVNGVIDATVTSNVTAAWQAFKTNMGTAGWNMEVVSAAHSDYHAVNTIVARANMKTQRRRQRR